MIIDQGLILATDEPPPNGGVVPGGLGADSVAAAIDLAVAHDTAGTVISDVLSDMELEITVTTSFVAAEPTTDADVTVTFDLVSMPLALSLLDDATTGKEMFIASVATDVTGGVAEDMFTLTGHGLLTGTPIFFDVVTTTTGIAIDTIYYVIRVNANVFQIATTRALAIAGTALGGLALDGSVTVRFIPFIHASTGEIPFSCLQAGARYVAKVNPFSVDGSTVPAYGSGVGRASTQPGWLPVPNRYLALRVLIANGNAGTVGRYSCNLALDTQTGMGRVYPTAVQVL